VLAAALAACRALGVEAKIRLREDSFSTIRRPSGLSWSRIGGKVDRAGGFAARPTKVRQAASPDASQRSLTIAPESAWMAPRRSTTSSCSNWAGQGADQAQRDRSEGRKARRCSRTECAQRHPSRTRMQSEIQSPIGRLCERCWRGPRREDRHADIAGRTCILAARRVLPRLPTVRICSKGKICATT
jgi:hypothetical protein